MNYPFLPLPENEVAPGVHQTKISGLLYIPHRNFPDHRGAYAELSRIPEIEAVTKQPFLIKQLNLSYSLQNVARGFHAENWNKLLTIVDGTCFCAWADFRPNSPTFGDTVSMIVGKEPGANFGSVYVSSGIGNSFCVLTGPAHYLYAVDELYADRDPKGDIAIDLFDQRLAVEWPLAKETMIISDRDRTASSFNSFFKL